MMLNRLHKWGGAKMTLVRQVRALNSLSRSGPFKDSSMQAQVLRPDLTELKAPMPKLDVALQGMPLLKSASQLKAPATQMTVLSNGLRVVTQETYGQASTIGMFVDCGSRYEDESTAGVTHVLEHLSFKSTSNRTHAAMVRDIEDIGGYAYASGGRDQLVYTIDVLRDSVEKATELLADTVLNPALIPEEIDSIKNILGFELEHMSENPAALLHEKLHEAAYGSTSSLGRPCHASKDQIPLIDVDSIRHYLSKFFIAPRMVLAGSGVEHARLVSLGERWFQDLPSQGVEKIVTDKAKYLGGSRQLEYPESTSAHVSLAFETGGWHDEEMISVCVLQMLLGGGESFSAGGPGKGMYTRLYTSVLNRFYWVEAASAFSSIHDDTGLLGIYGSTEPVYTSNLVAVFINQLLRVASERVTSIELTRAKNQLKSSMLMNLESRMLLFEDIGRQTMTYGKRQTPESLCEKIDAVTADDLMKVAQSALGSHPSLCCYGDPKYFPDYDAIVEAIRTGVNGISSSR